MRTVWRVLAALTPVAFAIGCGCECQGDLERYLLTSDVGDISWNGVTRGVDRDVTVVRALVPEGATPRGELLEVYRDDESLRIEGTPTGRAGLDAFSCVEGREIRYDLSSLPNGDYLLVHRRSSAPPDRDTDVPAAAWSMFEGEPALLSTLRIVHSPLAVSDAGPEPPP